MSRREADDVISEGRVSIDDEVAVLGARVSDNNLVKLDDTVISPPKYRYIMLNKPTGYVSSRASQDGTESIYSLLPDELHDCKIVGRLDRASEGLVLLTNDGEFAHDIQHPSKKMPKTYHVETDQPLEEKHIEALRKGVEIPDGLSALDVTEIKDYYQIIMTEGRNRQIRRTIGALDVAVTNLKRVSIGKLNLGDLKTGEWREFSPKSVYSDE